MTLTTIRGLMDLVDWRRRTAELYAEARSESETEPRAAWKHYRSARDRLFAGHPQSPLDEGQKVRFESLPYFPYDSAWRFNAGLELSAGCEDAASTRVLEVDLPEGAVVLRSFARAFFTPPVRGAGRCALTLYWVEGYGGGLFLPFRDLTNSDATYGGGRYLYDTIKGADPGAGTESIILDFNFAYNPSCAYNPRWACPLSPPENALPFRVEAGEKRPT